MSDDLKVSDIVHHGPHRVIVRLNVSPTIFNVLWSKDSQALRTFMERVASIPGSGTFEAIVGREPNLISIHVNSHGQPLPPATEKRCEPEVRRILTDIKLL